MTEPKYIEFIEAPQLSPKTKRWLVRAKEGGLIGEIKWYWSWRQYSFFPMSCTVFEKTCLRDIASFCEEQTRQQRYGDKQT